MENQTNLAFIDWQNLHLGTRSGWWTVDFVKLRQYLSDELHVTEAYYFLGYIDTEEQELYTMLQKAGFIVIFREHYASMTGDKKWNVDTDLVFEVLRCMIDRDDRNQAVLVSWDGDYIKLVKYLIKHKRLAKILFPNPHHSSLYNQIDEQYIMDLSEKAVKSIIRLWWPKSKKSNSKTKNTQNTQANAKDTQDAKPTPEKQATNTNQSDTKSKKPEQDTNSDTKTKPRRRRSSRKKSQTTLHPQGVL